MDWNEVKIRKEINEIKGQLLDGLEKLIAIENSIEGDGILEDHSNVSAAWIPIVFEGGFKSNVLSEESLIMSMDNEGNETLHFNAGVLSELGLMTSNRSPYIFGRIVDVDNKKIEGTFRVAIQKGEKEVDIIKSTTEKLNFSHPTNRSNRLNIENVNQVAFEPGDRLNIYLKSKNGLDTEASKIAFEDIVALERI